MIYFPGTFTFNTLPTSHLVIFLTGKLFFFIHKVVLPWMLLSFREMVRFSSKSIVRSAVGLSLAPAKRSQHANTTDRIVVGRNTFCAFGHRAAMCCDMLASAVLGSSLNMVKFEPTTPNMSQQGGQTRPTMLRYFALASCDRLAGALSL